MSYPGESSVDARVRAVEKEYAAKQTKLFTTFATVEVVLFVIAAVVVYVLRLVDAELGTFLFIGIALLGGGILSFLLMKHMRDRTAAIAQAKGENPLF